MSFTSRFMANSNSKCFIIAEAGVNHNGDLEKAKLLIDIAKEAGVDAVKFQTWISEELSVRDSPKADYQMELTDNSENQFDMLKKLELSQSDFVEIKRYCDLNDILFLSTPDEPKSLDFLCSLDMPIIKVGSGEANNLSYLDKIAQKKLPIILSTGMCDLDEIRAALNCIYEHHEDVTLLHCTSNYPALRHEVNLDAMNTIKDTFNVKVGYSDHTVGIDVSAVALIMGASVIEKHYTYDRNAEGPDHKASLTPSELNELVNQIRYLESCDISEKKAYLNKVEDLDLIKGDGIKKPTKSEIEISKVIRKKIVAAMKIESGEKLSSLNIFPKRTGKQGGIDANHFEELIGKTVTKPYEKDQMINLGDLN